MVQPRIRSSPEYYFFFSSRRRHTRSLRDWSSDVCSSDLGPSCSSSAAATASPPPRTTSAACRCRSRSEERRVGKECRSRLSPEYYKRSKGILLLVSLANHSLAVTPCPWL